MRSQGTPNRLIHNLVGTAVSLLNPAASVHAGDRVFKYVSVAASGTVIGLYGCSYRVLDLAFRVAGLFVIELKQNLVNRASNLCRIPDHGKLRPGTAGAGHFHRDR